MSAKPRHASWGICAAFARRELHGRYGLRAADSAVGFWLPDRTIRKPLNNARRVSAQSPSRPSNPSAKLPSFRVPFAEDCIGDMGEFGVDEIFGRDKRIRGGRGCR
jgi:hypothetical protein